MKNLQIITQVIAKRKTFVISLLLQSKRLQQIKLTQRHSQNLYRTTITIQRNLLKQEYINRRVHLKVR